MSARFHDNPSIRHISYKAKHIQAWLEKNKMESNRSLLNQRFPCNKDNP